MHTNCTQCANAAACHRAKVEANAHNLHTHCRLGVRRSLLHCIRRALSPSSDPMRILIVDPDKARRARLVDALAACAEAQLRIVDNTLGVVEHVAAFAPDMVIVACDAPARDAIDDLRRVTETNPRPIVMFVDKKDSEHAEMALRAGVAAYVTEGLNPERIQDIIDIAAAQFRVVQELRRDLAEARATLAGRKIIEQAKGVLMKRRGLDEKDAYNMLRKAAMDQGKPLVKVAEDLLAADKLLGGG
jgi:two-component system, response regulator / RNA-binding antiterminator